ncbi:uncharacterized protein [Ptychodera flava]|uniref:uncharacterized protein n=1 Tax=Ptychodera flava TaxID=63121 RepID=UPI00396A9F71
MCTMARMAISLILLLSLAAVEGSDPCMDENNSIRLDSCSLLTGDDFCSKMLNYRDSQHMIGYRWSCNCDQECLRYGDCCFDYLNVCRNQFLEDKTELPELSDSGIYACVKIDTTSPTNVWMVGKCKSSWQDSVIRAKCETTVPLGLSVQSIPVTWPAGSEIYRNIYCALCNGVNQSEIVEWKVKVNLVSNSLFHSSDINTFEDFVLATNYDYSGNKTAVDVIFRMEERFDRRLRACVPYIDSCDASFSEGRGLHLMCRSYFSIIEHKAPNEQQYYKNIHCAMCNKATERNACGLNFMTNYTNRHAFSLNLLFDIRSGGQIQLTTNVIGKYSFSHNYNCFEGEIFDLASQSCTTVVKRQRLDVDQHVVFNKTSANISVARPNHTYLNTSEEFDLSCPKSEDTVMLSKKDFQINEGLLTLA